MDGNTNMYKTHIYTEMFYLLKYPRIPVSKFVDSNNFFFFLFNKNDRSAGRKLTCPGRRL